MGIYQTLSRKKPFADSGATKLAKVLNVLDLTALGIGSTLGVGVYVIAGQVSKSYAGPAVIFSFLIAAIASIFAGLCYAEFGAKVPRAGSAYVYCYVTIGEFIAFIIGWNLILEYSIGAASVVKGLSTYVDSLTKMHTYLHDLVPIGVNGLSNFIDVFAFGVTMLFSIAVAFGAKESSRVNNIFTFLNLSVVIFVIIAGSFKANPYNWMIPAEKIPNTAKENFGTGGFAPYGLAGIFRGAATCFYGFIGFDCIATAGEEAKDPKRSMPIAIIGSLIVVFLTYFGISTVLTMMLPYFEQDPNAPLTSVFKHYGWHIAVYMVSIGAIFGLCASLMGSMFPLPRIIYAMSNDGLIFKWMGKIHPRFQTPVCGTMFVGTLTGILAAIFDLSQLVHMMSIGTLFAYSIVAACVLLLRYEVEDHDEKIHIPAPFKRNIIRFLWNTDNVRTPTKLTSIIVTWEVTVFCVLAAAMAFLIEILNVHLQKLNIWAWTLLIIVIIFAIATLILISRQPVARCSDSFSVPFIPWLPAISIAINFYLVLMLDLMTWIRFAIWIFFGLLIYFTYGIRNSAELKRRKQKELMKKKESIGKIFASSKEILVPSGQ